MKLRLRQLSVFSFLLLCPVLGQTPASEEVVRDLAQQAEAQLAANNIESALTLFRRAAAALPERVGDGFFGETVARMPFAISVRGYRAEAITFARELDARFAAEPARLSAFGELYLSLESPDDAQRVLVAAVKLAPEDAALCRSLGGAYRMGLRLDEAVAQYRRAVKLAPRDKRAYGELADLLRGRGEYEEAIKLYRTQLLIEPLQTAPRKGLALSHLAEGRAELARKELDEVRRARSAEEVTRDLYLQTQMAFYHLAQGQLAQAREAADRAVTVEPRYSWGRIIAAEVDLAEGRYFEAERHLLAAARYSNFPTLYFTLGKLYLAVDDFDGALDHFARAFSYTRDGQFSTRLGGVIDARAAGLDELLARERQAAIFVANPPGTEEQFKLAEALARFDFLIRNPSSGAAPRRRPARVGGGGTLESVAREFVEASGGRRPFRALYAARRLTQADAELPLAVKLAEVALGLAEVATEADGSLRDYPNFDRDGRLRVFRGRALDARGWALFKQGSNPEAVAALSEAVEAYGTIPEGKRATWHLATARETAGETQAALDLYLAAYEPPTAANPGSDLNRAVIEAIYRKVNGSLQGLDERIGRAPGGDLGVAAAPARPATDAPAEPEPAVKAAVKEAVREKEDQPAARADEEPRASAPARFTPVYLPDGQVPPPALLPPDAAVIPLSPELLAEPQEAPPAVATEEAAGSRPRRAAPAAATTTRSRKVTAAEPEPPPATTRKRRLSGEP